MEKVNEVHHSRSLDGSSEAAEETAKLKRHLREERLSFPPFYVVVGVYRLLTDKSLFVPIWEKCKHGFMRGAALGLGWGLATFNIQSGFVRIFLKNSPRVTGLSHDSIFGYQMPFTVTTYATLLMVLNQITLILTFFLSKNIRVARERAWDQTVLSRAKTADFWGPYVEEYAVPPRIERPKWNSWERWAGSGLVRTVVLKGVLLHLSLYPFVGIAVGAYLKAVNTAKDLHKQYFDAKKMTKDQIAIFMEERKWDYRAFGFTAALLESIPIIGLGFSVSNRIGAAMWAHDLEKRQHAFASGAVKLVPLPEPRPSVQTEINSNPMVGSWKDQ